MLYTGCMEGMIYETFPMSVDAEKFEVDLENFRPSSFEFFRKMLASVGFDITSLYVGAFSVMSSVQLVAMAADSKHFWDFFCSVSNSVCVGARR